MHSALQHRADKTFIPKISQPKHLSRAQERSRSRTLHALLHMRKKSSEPRWMACMISILGDGIFLSFIGVVPISRFIFHFFYSIFPILVTLVRYCLGSRPFLFLAHAERRKEGSGQMTYTNAGPGMLTAT